MKKVLIVTSCTGEKRFSPANQLTQDDFRDAKTREKELIPEFKQGEHKDLI